MYEVMVDRFLPGGTSKAGPNGPPTDPRGRLEGRRLRRRDAEDQRRGTSTPWASTRSGSAHPSSGRSCARWGRREHRPLPVGVPLVLPDRERVDVRLGERSRSSPPTASPTPSIRTSAWPPISSRSSTRRTSTASACSTDLVVNHVFADSAPPERPGPAARAALERAPGRAGVVQHPLRQQRQRLRGNENLWDSDLASRSADLEPGRLLVRSVPARLQLDQPLRRRRDRRTTPCG